MRPALGYVVQDNKITYWNWNTVRVLVDDGEVVQLDFAIDHALRFVGEARLGVLRSLREMGLSMIDLKAMEGAPAPTEEKKD